MRSFVPFVLVFLAIFIAGCIAYIAWEFSSDRTSPGDPTRSKDET
ncbi:MAG: hypothetical protein O2805_02130 [Proteobacteria bacterium]|nr:hypothetical protein [Pseudomonadota bacterium]